MNPIDSNPELLDDSVALVGGDVVTVDGIVVTGDVVAGDVVTGDVVTGAVVIVVAGDVVTGEAVIDELVDPTPVPEDASSLSDPVSSASVETSGPQPTHNASNSGIFLVVIKLLRHANTEFAVSDAPR